MEHNRDQDLLQIDDLTKVFTLRQGLSVSRLVAVDRARFSMPASPQIFTLAGESGSGKTTLARMILGLEQPTSGHVYFRGRDVATLTRRERRSRFMKEVQPVFQDPFATFSPLKRIDNYLYETAFNYRMAERSGVSDYVDEVLHLVGLSLREVKGRYPNELSGGQVQRMSVARALVTEPSLLVADEPVSMLDASLRMSIVNLLMELKERKDVSVVYITHDLATAYYVADQIAIMLRGWIVEMGSVEKVLGNPLHPYTQILKHSVPQADPDRKWEEKTDLAMLETEEYLRTGCKFAGRCPAAMEMCQHSEPGNYFVDGRSVRCFLYGNDDGGRAVSEAG
jgi:peptide/nickel transport system ATP-binding protein